MAGIHCKPWSDVQATQPGDRLDVTDGMQQGFALG